MTDRDSVSNHIVVCAELGINHNGSLPLAKQMMDAAKSCGADYCKFQKRTIDLVYTPAFLDQPRESPFGTTQRHQKEGLEFGQDAYEQIEAYSKQIGLPWFASAWDIPSLEFLEQFNPPYVKIASPMVTNITFVEKAASLQRPTLVSTGMSTLSEAMTALVPFLDLRIVKVLHCVSEYPCPDERLNLAMIPALLGLIGDRVGYSAHQVSPIPSIIAAAMGASVIEAHLTLDRAMYGSDQAASLEPKGFEMMVKGIRTVEVTRGDGVKRITAQEAINATKLRYWL